MVAWASSHETVDMRTASCPSGGTCGGRRAGWFMHVLMASTPRRGYGLPESRPTRNARQ
jgi:hypothetical protein